jgi:predicted nucleic acid-binding protein
MPNPKAEALVDANILVRYLTNEPPEQADRAADLLRAAELIGVELGVASPTVAEVVYVLETVYAWERTRISDLLLSFIGAQVVTILEHDAVVQALIWYRNIHRLDFEDAYIAAVATSRRHRTVVSFDPHLRRIPGLRVLSSSDDFRSVPAE